MFTEKKPKKRFNNNAKDVHKKIFTNKMFTKICSQKNDYKKEMFTKIYSQKKKRSQKYDHRKMFTTFFFLEK